MPSATPPSQLASHPDIPPFPSPSTFSILPDIYLLIARLNILQTQHHHQQQQPGSQQTQAQSQSQSQQLSHPTPSTTLAGGPTSSSNNNNTQAAPSTQSTTHIHHNHHLSGTTPPAATATPTTTNAVTPRHIQTSGPPIDAKELPAHVYPIKQKLVKARAAVLTLPDLDRSVEEQEVEMRQLQREVALLKARLAKLGGIAGRSAAAAPVAAPKGSNSVADTAMQGVVDG